MLQSAQRSRSLPKFNQHPLVHNLPIPKIPKNPPMTSYELFGSQTNRQHTRQNITLRQKQKEWMLHQQLSLTNLAVSGSATFEMWSEIVAVPQKVVVAD